MRIVNPTDVGPLLQRPIFHGCDDAIRGRVFCSFLAPSLRVELEERLARRDWKLEWADIVHDLDHLQEVAINVDGKAHRNRHAPKRAGPSVKCFRLVESRCRAPCVALNTRSDAAASGTLLVPLRPRNACKWLN
jgi:hypothetical protein